MAVNVRLCRFCPRQTALADITFYPWYRANKHTVDSINLPNCLLISIIHSKCLSPYHHKIYLQSILCIHIHIYVHNAPLFFPFTGWYEDNWYEVNLENENISCTREQMKQAAEGHLTTEALMWNQNNHQKTISGMSSEDFRYCLI